MSSPATDSTPRSAPCGAVFVSYASQDAEAARRICEALRAAGIEVWFDQNELGGGDAWDRKIRAQIGTCALFVPVVSAATQARREGYFRLEWKLADERTHLMAEGTPFILPVVIDDTTEREALVPKSFLAVQWTRAIGGQATSGFCERVRSLLGGAVADVGPVADRAPGQRPGLQPKVGRRVPAAAWGAAIALLVLALVAVWWRQSRTGSNAGGGTRPPTAEASTADKSVAVLPFENLSGDKDNEYFSDGISDELLNLLGKVPGLRVAGRTSAFSFKGKNVPDAEIARTLGVAYVVNGTVQKAGTQVRITARLNNAADGFQIWSEKFTEELKDIFAVQDKIAGLIAQNLQLTLGAARPARSVNPEAHRLVLEGRHFWMLRTDVAFERAEAAYQRAIELDPDFAEAHAGLADVWAIRGWYRIMAGNAVQAAADFVRAKEEVRRAQALNPALAEPYATLGVVLMNEFKFDESERQFAQAITLNPNYAVARHWHATLLDAVGRLDEGIKEIERSISLDPLSPNALWQKALSFRNAGRGREALDAAERALALRPIHPAVQSERAQDLWNLGRRDEAIAAARAVGRDLTAQPRWYADSSAIYVLRQAGLQSEAEAYAERALANVPKDDYRYGSTLVALGRGQEALTYLRTLPVAALVSAYWHPMWDPLREDAQFQQWLVKLGCAAEYKVARETQARMLKEQAGRK